MEPPSTSLAFYRLTLPSRGKKVFRKFDSDDDGSDLGDRDPTASHRQRALRRAAGTDIERTITRSSVKPRLLFPPANEALHASDIDEEAETDIEAAASPAVADELVSSKSPAPATPAKKGARAAPMMSPPSRARASRTTDAASFQDDTEELPNHAALPTPARSSKKKVAIDPIPVYEARTPEPEANGSCGRSAGAQLTPARYTRKKTATSQLSPLTEDEQETPAAGSGASTPIPTSGGKRKVPSPFDNWPRTKGGAKRAGDKLEGASTKRTRSSAATETK